MTTKLNMDFNATDTDLVDNTTSYTLNHRHPPGGSWDFKSIYTQEGSSPTDYEVTIIGNDEMKFDLKTAAVTNNTIGRIQMDHFVNTESMLEYKRVKLNTALSSYKNYGSITWFVTGEHRSGLLGEDDHRARVTQDLVNVGGELYLVFTASYQSPVDSGIWQPMWTAPVNYTALPIDEYFDLYTLIRIGDESDGRYAVYLKFDNQPIQTLCNVQDRTYNPRASGPVNLRHLNTCKVYTNSSVINYVSGQGGSCAISYKEVQVWTP